MGEAAKFTALRICPVDLDQMHVQIAQLPSVRPCVVERGGPNSYIDPLY
jgi:hypothetical protein